MENRIPPFLRGAAGPLPDAPKQARLSFIDGFVRFGSFISATLVQSELASRKGLMQATDSRVKLVCLLFLLVVGTLKSTMASGLALSGGLLCLVLLSRLNPLRFYGRIFALAFFFGFLVLLPASCNVVTGGEIILPLFKLRAARTIWGYAIPETVGLTREGLSVVGLVSLRMVNCLSTSFLLLATTPLPEIMRSLRVLRVPDMLCLVFVLTYKYIFIFSRMVEAVYLARKSRSVGRRACAGEGTWAAGRVAFLFRKTQLRCEDVFQAMLSRGLTGNVELARGAPLRAFDIACGVAILSFGVVLLCM